MRERIGTWFNPDRWSGYDKLIAVAAVAAAGSLFLPWFKATVRTRDPEVSGVLIGPPGWVSGIAGHLTLDITWDYGALAALGAVLISLAVTIAGFRDDPRP